MTHKLCLSLFMTPQSIVSVIQLFAVWGAAFRAPKSHDARKGDVRRMALTKRHNAMTSEEIKSPIVSIAITLLPCPDERNPFMNDKLGMKR